MTHHPLRTRVLTTVAALALVLTGSGAGIAASAVPTPATATVAADPTLTEQNTTRNHTMGSTVQAAEPTPAVNVRTFSAKAAPAGVQGMDVSGWQTGVNWGQQYANGARFVYIKATEDTDYQSSQFPSQYNGSAAAGLLRGAYHFATPNTSDGATQARYFVSHGGGWSADGRTLPPLLDIEYNPYTASDHTNSCWGLTAGQMQAWISSFVTTVRSLTGVNPAIYSTANWWSTCTGNATTFGAYPLFVACYCSGVGTIPGSWMNWTLWQYADAGTFPGDQDVFNGSLAQLTAFALGGVTKPPTGVFDTATVSTGQPFTVTGWTFDQTNITAPVQLRVNWNTPTGVTTATVTANLSRPDVGAAYPAAGANHGFTVQAPWAGSGQYAACITAIAQPNNTAGNADLGCKYAFTSAATGSAPAAQRLAGSDRFETAIAISKDQYPTAGVPVAYVASGLNFPDALAAAPAAAAQHGPVLLTPSWGVQPTTLTELGRLRPAKIVVVGGPDSVSETAVGQLQAIAPVTRIGGSDRFETARNLAVYAFPNATKAYIASGIGFADALSAGPAAAKDHAPLLLAGRGGIDQATGDYLTTHGVKQTAIVGGPDSVSTAFQQGVTAAGATVTRYAGADRFATSAAITASAFPAAANAYLANGVNFPDALVAAAAAGAASKPLLLSLGGCVPRTIGDQVVRMGTTSVKVAGGQDTLNQTVAALGVCY